MCLDIDSTGMHRTLRLWPCHGSGENDYWKQFFAFQESGLIVTAEEICVGVNEHKQVILVHCTDDDKTKLWTYDKEVGVQITYLQGNLISQIHTIYDCSEYG